MASDLQYSEVPERAATILENFFPPKDKIEARVRHFGHVSPRPSDQDGTTEILNGVSFTHHFVDAPGDYETVNWHYVTAGDSKRPAIVFLHGVPDSWFGWHLQMAALAGEYFCVAVDLKGYGQSTKQAGDYRHEGVSEQLFAMLQQIGLQHYFLATHDRGTVQADFIVARHPDSVLGYARGEQHLYHFHPSLAPQEAMFRDAPYSGRMEDPRHFVCFVYTWITALPISDAIMERVIQEFSYPDISRAVPRYFASSSFRQEWLARRQKLMRAWTCPVVILEGYESKTQPREWYEDVKEYIPNAKAVEVRYLKGGHFWALEDPEGSTQAIRRMLELAKER